MEPTRAVITGASSGIGEEFARILASQGVNLVIAARRTERLEKLQSELEGKHGIQVEVFTLDLSQAGEAEKFFQEVSATGEVDLLINNAGAGPYRAFLKTSLQEHQKIMMLNMRSLMGLCHLFGEHMMKHKKPSVILNIASIAAYTPVPKYAVYCATKSYVKVFSEILNFELRQTNVSVSCLCPGGTNTEFLKKNNQKTAKYTDRFLMSAREVAEKGLKGAFKKKVIIIPGLMNKLTCFLAMIVPTFMNLRINETAMGMAVEEID